MFSTYTVLSVLFCHWFFDFFLQTPEMANGKSKEHKPLADHVYVYSIGLMVMCLLNIFILQPHQIIVFVLVNATAHYFTDYLTSRATSSLYREERYREFFSVIGLDQFIHYTTLFLTLNWVTTL
jgi:hypothetical protein